MGFEIRGDGQRTRGCAKLVAERAEHLRLVREGMSGRRACEVVGVSPRTDRRWQKRA
ncbi:helix-turn-helix domain-containing protein [Nonomuraea endophytica]|uniref:helix-turn-helix domain-containing protein n=1 Tax=Nonomuraea endophytica TaxID=714136 RepID=UPI00160E282F